MKKRKHHPKARVRPELTIRHATMSGFPFPILATPELVKVLEKGKRATSLGA